MLAGAGASSFIVKCGGAEVKLTAASAAECAGWVADIQRCMDALEAAEAAAPPADLASVLAASGLGEYVAMLLAEKFTLENIADLTDANMKELGIPMAPRNKIAKIAKLFAGGAG